MINRFSIPRTRLAAIFLVTFGIFGGDPCFSALQYQPVDSYSNRDECALVLDGPGRSSAFDYSYNLLRGSFPPSAGTQTCITYDAVNHAYIEARKRINVAQPNTETWRGEDLATVGELLLDISVNLAQKYGLTYEDIEKGLPLIDTSKTLIREICPAFLSDVECRAGKYRRYDGLCTNLENPTWGATNTPFTRLLAPRFADGINAPRISVTGNELPLARVVSRTMHPDEGFHDHAGTVMVIAWGQFMDHDYTLTATPLDPMNRNDPEECCNRPPHLKNPYCNEILIPEDDYFYRLFNVRCMNFVRGFPAPRPGCRLGSRVPFNLLTGVLDGNTVYGVSDDFARKLRTGYGGLLRMNPVFSEYGLKDLLPLKLDIPDEGCTRPNKSMYCFEAGEIRVNEQLVLTCMHTLLAREHNRAANALAQVNPHWDDETIFQEARRIVIAEIQHVTYNEFLPILLGKEVMEKFGLLLQKEGYWDGYDPTVNPGVIDAFAAAAYRFGHSLLPTAVERWSKAHKFIASKRLSDLIRRPYDLYRAGVLDEYFMGLMNQVAQAMDDSITQEVTNHLFKKVGSKFGMDLVSFNMQRGREFAIPSYMEFRKFCGLPGANNFDELLGSMPNETISRYSSIFQHPDDVDLWSGGVSERPLPGSMLGPTFACIIATQFSYSKRGDRFWYELPNQPSSFTPEQLVEIRKARLARLICDNTDLIDTIQLYPFVLPDHEINPRVPCRSGILPGIDFSKWAEYPAGPGNAADYNYLGTWLLPLKVMPPLAYARFPKTVKRKLIGTPKKMKPVNAVAFKLAQPRSPHKSDSSYVKKLAQNKNWKSSNSPAIIIKKSTKIISHIPISNYFQGNEIDTSGYLRYEESNIEISPMFNSFRGKRYSPNNLFDYLLRNDFSDKGQRLRRGISQKLKDSNKKSEDFDEVKNVSRLLDILTGNRKEEPSKIESFRHRSKRQIPEDKINGKFGKRETENNVKVTANNSRKRAIGKRKPQYTPVFKECNDTAASEISDLNAPPPPSPERVIPLQRYFRYGAEFSGDIDFAPKKKPPINNIKKNQHPEFLTTVPPPAFKEKKIVENPQKTISISEDSKNATYINLQDHQKGTQDGNIPKNAAGYPIDIPPYNPDIIPYVDVPDYSDQREESLDEDDRRVAKERFVEYPDDDVDAVDPGLPSKSNKPPEKITVQDDDELPEKLNDSKTRRVEAAETEEEEEEEEEEEAEDDRNSRISNDNDNFEEEKEHEETNFKGVRNLESTDDPKSFKPIHFDIEEYRKPFNLEKLLEDIDREVEKDKEKDDERKGGDLKEHESSKNIPVREEVNSDVLGKYQNENPTVAPPNFFEEFERVFGPSVPEMPFTPGYFDVGHNNEELSESPAQLEESEDEKYSETIEDTYDKLFAPGNERKTIGKGEKPYYNQYSDDDDVSSFLPGLKKKDEETEPEEPYKSLASILVKKDDISRLDDEVVEKAKTEGKMPAKYRNYWTLEYGAPIKEEKT